MNSRPKNLNVALLLASVAAFTACQADQIQTSATVNTYEVSRENLPINVKEGGELVAVNEQVVRSLIEGNATILSLIPEGTLVKPGDKLVELDVSSLVDLRATQEISVEKARNAFEQAKTALEILEKELITKKNTAASQRLIKSMELEKLLGANDGSGSEGRNADMVTRLQDLVTAPEKPEKPEEPNTESSKRKQLVAQVHPQNYAGLVNKVTELLKIEGEAGDPLQRDMGEMANQILQQVDLIRLAMADLKVKEDTVVYSRGLAKKQFITQNELEGDELDYQRGASTVTIAWNNLELLINYTLRSDKITLKQDLANAELEVERVLATNNAERSNGLFDVEAKQKEWEVATERLQNLEKQIGNAIIYSPGSGLVVYSKVSRGRGDSEPMEEGTSVRERQSIIILPDNSELMCEIKVQEAMIDKVRVGLSAYISAEVRPNEVLTGRVSYIAPVADSASRWGGNDKKVYTTKVVLDGINTDDALKAGMKASATITVETIKSVLTAPIQAVRRDRSVNYVWKQTASGPLAVAVTIGANNEEKVEVKEGLAEGDVIYRTPPGGQADPKFDQPALPEVSPAKPSNGGTDTIPGNRGGSSNAVGGSASNGSSQQGNSGGGGRPARKKYNEMTPAELATAKKSLLAMPDRMGAMLDAAKMAKVNAAIPKIINMMDKADLAGAQALYDTTMKSLFSGGGRKGGSSRRGGE